MIALAAGQPVMLNFARFLLTGVMQTPQISTKGAGAERSTATTVWPTHTSAVRLELLMPTAADFMSPNGLI